MCLIYLSTFGAPRGICTPTTFSGYQVLSLARLLFRHWRKLVPAGRIALPRLAASEAVSSAIPSEPRRGKVFKPMRDTDVTIVHRADGTCVLQWKNGKWTACDHNQTRGYSPKEAVIKAREIKARLQAGEQLESSAGRKKKTVESVEQGAEARALASALLDEVSFDIEEHTFKTLEQDPKRYRGSRIAQRMRRASQDKLSLESIKPAPKGPFNKAELERGTEEEKEHTTDPQTARTIAKHHLKPQGPPREQNYYRKLKKYVEPKAKAILLALPKSSSTPSSPSLAQKKEGPVT